MFQCNFHEKILLQTGKLSYLQLHKDQNSNLTSITTFPNITLGVHMSEFPDFVQPIIS